MAVLLSPVGGVAAQFFTNAGVPLSGGKIYTYAAGTSTPQATYTTGAGNIQHSNPIVLDAAGRVPTGEIWLTDGLSYKFVLKDANDVLIATYDNIVGINSNFVNFVNQQEIQTATAGQTVFTLTTMQYQVGTGNLSVFVDGVNQYGPGAQYAYTETSSTVVTFVSGLHVGASVKFTTTEIQNSGIGDASQITYTYPEVNAVQESVEERLAQYVSVKDFGAIGDGVTDDTDAFQNAIDNGGMVFVPVGNYKIDGELTVTASGTQIVGAGKESLITLNSSTIGIAFSGGIENVKLANVKLYSSSATNTLVSTKGINDLAIINNVNFEGGGIQLLITSDVSSAGSYGIHVQNCLFYAASIKGVSIAPQSVAYAQAIFITDCEFFGNKQSLFVTSGSGIFVDKCRFERISVLSGATAAIHADTSNKFVLTNCYIEDNNAVNIVELGSAINGAVVENNYFTLNQGGGVSALVPFKCTSAGDNIVFNKNYMVVLGTITVLADFAASTNIQCKNNVFNASTVTTGISSSCSSLVADISENTFFGTYTAKSNQRVQALLAKAWCSYNGTVDSLNGGVGITPTKNATGNYTFTFTNAMPNAYYSVVVSSIAASNGSLICVPTVDSQTTSNFVIKINPTGGGTGGLADSSLLNIVVFGDKFN